MKRTIYAAVVAAMAGMSASALELPDIFSSGAVLQQESDARIWGWAAPGSTVTVTPSWSGQSVSAKADKTGRWQTTLATPEASFIPYNIEIAGDGEKITLDDVLIGEVWFCSGQSNMEMPLRGFGIQPIEGAAQAIAYSGKYPGIRVATVPKLASYEPQTRAPGKWKVSSPENAGEFTALGYFFAQSLTDILNVPVGIINCSYGGSKVEGWMPKEKLDTYPGWNMDAERDSTALNEWERIGVMYNAMLHPLIGYTIRGFLWNQGESNVGRHDEYPYHQADMVEIWRGLWEQGNLPFYFVEIPGWEYGNVDGTSAAYFRECQHKAAGLIPNSGIVCTTDLTYPYEAPDIHARQKQPIGERLAFMAADRTYGIKGMHSQYPAYKSVSLQGDKAVLTFSNSYGGLNPNVNLQGFEVAGDDRVFHPATATEDWNDYTVTVTSPEVSDIKAVRYCFRNFAPGSLKDMLGLPLIPFRTDTWPDGDTTSQPHNEP